MTKERLHPVFNVYDGRFNTASGLVVDLLNPMPETIRLADIAKGLSNICRFGGQIDRFHSVAKHTLLVWYLAPSKYKKAALLHDAAEAYLGDVIKPLKVLIESTYSPFEDQFTKVIFEKYKVDIADLEHLKPYDMGALGIEHEWLRNDGKEFKRAFAWIDNLLFGSPYTQLIGLLRDEFGHLD